MRNFRITFLIVGCLFVFGIYALARIPKQEFPEYTIRQGVVVGVYPGATAEEVEEQLAKPLEQFLMTYKEVKRAKTTSTSQNGMCYVMVELNDDVNDKDEVWSKVKHGLAAFKMQLPAGVAAVVTNDDFGDTSALLITLESDTRSYRELKGYMDDLSDRLRRIESVSNLRPYGVQQEQISVYADPERLAAYGIGEKTLSAALAAQGLTPLGGSVSNAETETPIHIAPSLAGEREVAEQIVWSDPEGHVLRVKDVARVVREYDDPDSYIRNNGHRCVLLSLEMQAGNNIVEYGREVDEVLHAFIEEELPADVSVQRIADQAKVVGDSVHSFLRDLFVAMAIIIVVMMLLFPLRSAIVAALTIPMSTFISVGMMYLCGIPLNTVTLAALVVVLGMIVDNSIVVIDGYLDYLGRGHSRWFAAVESAREFFPSLLLATICICMIFYPILFTMTGMMGDFLTWFPWTITINLMVSLLLAVMEKAERDTYDKDEKRETNAIRLQPMFVRRPGTTAKTVLEQVKNAYYPRLSVKSRNFYEILIGQIMEQISRECKVGLVSYTITHHTRQSAIGLPFISRKNFDGKEMAVTEYTMSEIIASVYETMERTCCQEGILFLDEINCVSETLAPTMLQFLQNKTFGTHRVPEGWVIVAAGNPPEYNKSVREFDVVTLDRVRQINVEADLDIWLDYAREKQLHGAVISYLSVKRERFYVVKRTEDNLSFVTARGWEDLSQILKGYEALQVPVTEALVSQFLHHEETARDFAAYYRLYQTYGSDYAIPEILNGTLAEEAYQERVAMARGGSFDERITVVNLVLDALGAEFAAYAREDAAVVRLHELLGRYKNGNQSLTEFITANRKSLEIKRQNALLSTEEARREEWVLHRLGEMELAVKQAHIRDEKEQLVLLRTLFGQDVQRREDLIRRIQTELSHGFRFVADCFGEGQEMILLVSALTRTPNALTYIGRHGCEPYLHYAQALMYRQQEAALQQACREVL